MRVGAQGRLVAAWQRFLREVGCRDAQGRELADDGDFGSKTEYATRVFQRACVGLGVRDTGEVDADTLRVAAAQGYVDPAEDTDPELEVPYVQARHYTPANRMRVDLVVIHTMENQEKPGSAMQVAQWFASKGSPRASAHYCVDRDQVVRTVREHDIAWHAPGANHNGIGVEHAGFARQSAAEWADEYSTTMLHRSARLVAGICSRWGIPAVRVTADELKRGGARGICGHLDCTQAFSDGKGHWDPGGFFPWVEYLEWVRAALDGGR